MKPATPLCLLFDCDGTLVDSEILLAEVMGDILPEFGLPFQRVSIWMNFAGCVSRRSSKPWKSVFKH